MKITILLGLVLCVAGCASVPPPRVRQTAFGGPIWGESQRRAGVIFQDGGQSIPLNGGTLWTFGDTFIGQPQPGRPPQNSQIRGSVWTTLAWLPAGQTNLPPQLAYLTGANGAALCPLTLFADEDAKHRRLWPAGGIGLGPRVYLYYSMIETTDQPGPWNFHGVGAGLAVAVPPDWQFTRLRPAGRAQFPVLPSQVLEVDGTLYLYEISDQPKGLVLARVPAAQIENPAAYEFFTGAAWATNRAAARPILREAYGQVSIAWNPALHCFVMATSSNFFHPHEIQLRLARHPEGPWSRPARITVPEFPGKETQVVYCTYLHPELSDGRHLVLTFCRTLVGDWALSNPEWMTLDLAPTAQ